MKYPKVTSLPNVFNLKCVCSTCFWLTADQTHSDQKSHVVPLLPAWTSLLCALHHDNVCCHNKSETAKCCSSSSNLSPRQHPPLLLVCTVGHPRPPATFPMLPAKRRWRDERMLGHMNVRRWEGAAELPISCFLFSACVVCTCVCVKHLSESFSAFSHF